MTGDPLEAQGGAAGEGGGEGPNIPVGPRQETRGGRCTSVLPPHRGGAVPSPMGMGRNGRTDLPRGSSKGSPPLSCHVSLWWWWYYPTPSEEWGHGGTPRRPNSQATPQGLDYRSRIEREEPKVDLRRGSEAGQSRRR